MRCQKYSSHLGGCLRLALCTAQDPGGLHLVMGLSSPSAYDFFIMIDREVPSAYDLNSAGQLEQTQKPLLPSADALLRRPSLVQADHTSRGAAWPGTRWPVI